MVMPKGNNDKLIANIAVHPAGFWWEYMRLVLGFTESCAKSFMDSFEMGARLGASHCTLDMVTWEIDNELGEIRARFGEAMDEAMSNVEEEEIVTDGILFNSRSKAELLATMRVKDDLKFDGGDGVSCASGFAGSVGNSTNRSVNSKRMVLVTEVNKQLQDKASGLEKENEK